MTFITLLADATALARTGGNRRGYVCVPIALPKDGTAGRTGVSKEDRVIDDLSDLARIVGVPSRELRAAIGSPWHRVRPAAYDLDLGPMFVGRDGEAAAILCLSSAGDLIGANGIVTHVGGSVLVGMAMSSTMTDGREGWRLGGSQVSLTRSVGTEGRGFLTSLHAAVTRAVAQKASFRDSDLDYRPVSSGSAFAPSW